MKLTFISDTHGQHESLELEGGDILVHAGDLSKQGTEWEIKKFLEWYSKQPYQYKIFIAGNHDFFFEEHTEAEIKQILPDNLTYLNDSGAQISTLNFWGSPIQPTFFNWAFNRDRGPEIAKHWAMIPAITDILITHGPPYGILDQTERGALVGCEELLSVVTERKPRIHVFGHIHEAYGIKKIGSTQFINASVLNLSYKLTNRPINIELNI